MKEIFFFSVQMGSLIKYQEQELASTLKSEKTIDEKAATLIDLANEYGGEDNITLIIIEYSIKILYLVMQQ